MNNKTVTVDKSILKSKLIPIAAVLFAIAAIVSIITVIKFFDPQSMIAIKSKFKANQITDPSAISTYTFLYILSSVVCCITSIILTIGLFLNVLGKNYSGLNFLYFSSKIFYYALTGSGIVVAVYFVYRLLKYIIESWQFRQDYFGIIAAIFWEGFIVAIITVVFFKLRKFLYSCIITTTSLNYTICLNKLDAPSLPPISVLGFLIFGVVNFYMVIDRMFTFSYAAVGNQVEHYLNITPVHMQQLSSVPFFFAGIGCILLYVYLRSYKKKAERLLNVTIKDVLV